MKYLLALQVSTTQQSNAVVVYNDVRIECATLIDGATALPLVFDTHTECENAKIAVDRNYLVIPVHHMILCEYPRKSVFSTDQFYHSPNTNNHESETANATGSTRTH